MSRALDLQRYNWKSSGEGNGIRVSQHRGIDDDHLDLPFRLMESAHSRDLPIFSRRITGAHVLREKGYMSYYKEHVI